VRYQWERMQLNSPVIFEQRFEYDNAGNRLLGIDGTARTTYTYDFANQLNKSEDASGVTSYTYDLDGNRTRKETPSELTDYTYDAAGRMTLAEPIAGNVEFVYNGLGQRVTKETPTETVQFVYDFQRLLQETDAQDDVQKQYTFAPEDYGQLVSEHNDLEDASSFYNCDGQWSTNALLDADETATDRYRYRAFGLEQFHGGNSENPFTFVGKQGYYRDPELELYFLGMSGNGAAQGGRFYDPAAGRFVTADPIGYNSGDDNFYRYVENNPVNIIDPNGLATKNISTAEASTVVQTAANAIVGTRPGCGKPQHVRFLSKQFYDEQMAKYEAARKKGEVAWKPPPVWSGKSPKDYDGTYISGKNFDAIMKDLESIGGSKCISVLEFSGHAQLSDGITIGDLRYDETEAKYGKGNFWQTYIDESSAKKFAEHLARVFEKNCCKPKLLILESCVLGNYTKSDIQNRAGETIAAKSTVQIIANTLEIPVLSPGGYSSGSFFSPNYSPRA